MTLPEGRFPPTRYSVVEAVASTDDDVRRVAWGALVEAYWKPVYKHLRMQWRADPERAADWTQEFFARALEKGFFDRFDPARARFRTFLRVCLDGFAGKERQAERRLKRGGGIAPLSLDFASAEGELRGAEPAAPDRSEEQFHREWMRALLEASLEDLRAAFERDGRARWFEVLRRYDVEAPESGGKVSYADLAREHGVPVTQITNWLHAARRALREKVLERLRNLCASDEEFREEAKALLGVG